MEDAMQAIINLLIIGMIVIAALSNTLVKCGFVVGLGERAVGLRIAGATAVLTAVALGALALT